MVVSTVSRINGQIYASNLEARTGSAGGGGGAWPLFQEQPKGQGGEGEAQKLCFSCTYHAHPHPHWVYRSGPTCGCLSETSRTSSLSEAPV